jgi:methionyl-tRNA synthetase
MYHMLESQRIVYCLLSCFMPKTAAKGLGYLGSAGKPSGESLSWGGLAAGVRVTKAEPLFPRIEEQGE